ncbi:hypothetical protein AQUCO_02600169v1 [Aquilegia coerulea]|uniref:Uncharacterized protein n=1 Tax=Aquilegia coerulea TaxID=218851 RepID=A0A2G5D7Q6_AQUCA|nr:hypothetical protein AQUCO_02600169v1 [Aquilegia coerulea]
MAQSGTENQVISIEGIKQCFTEWLWTQDIWVTYLRHVPLPLAFSTTCLSLSLIFMFINLMSPKHANEAATNLLALTSCYGLLALVPLIIFTSYKALKAIFQCLIHCACLNGVGLWILADIVIEVLQCVSFALLVKYSTDNSKMISTGGLILMGVSSGISIPYTVVILKILLRYKSVFKDSHRRDNKMDSLRTKFKTIVSSINQLYRNLAEANRIATEEMVRVGAKEIVDAEEAMKNNKYKEELALISSQFSDISRRIAEAQRVARRV